MDKLSIIFIWLCSFVIKLLNCSCFCSIFEVFYVLLLIRLSHESMGQWFLMTFALKYVLLLNLFLPWSVDLPNKVFFSSKLKYRHLHFPFLLWWNIKSFVKFSFQFVKSETIYNEYNWLVLEHCLHNICKWTAKFYMFCTCNEAHNWCIFSWCIIDLNK